jgi:hypothetical protein
MVEFDRRNHGTCHTGDTSRQGLSGGNSDGATTRSTKPKRKASSAPTGSPVSRPSS